jgi:hypothetical protein
MDISGVTCLHLVLKPTNLAIERFNHSGVWSRCNVGVVRVYREDSSADGSPTTTSLRFEI